MTIHRQKWEMTPLKEAVGFKVDISTADTLSIWPKETKKQKSVLFYERSKI